MENKKWLLTIIVTITLVSIHGRSFIGSKATDTIAVALVGSTPGDHEIRSVLGLEGTSTVDFIRWDLVLQSGNSKTFELNLLWGESQQGTPGFIGGGTKTKIEGQYTITKKPFGKINRDVYTLKSDNLHGQLQLVKLNDNLFHPLNNKNALMVGNAGWSYTLSRKEPVPQHSSMESSLVDPQEIIKDTARQITFVGRTPCSALLKDHHWPASVGRVKLKWKIVLRRDPVTGTPAGYTMRRVDEHANDTEGKWEIIRKENAVLYKLDYVNSGESIVLLVGDGNVVFLVDREHRIYSGDGDWSFTLNRE